MGEQEPGLSQGMCEVATACLEGGRYCAFNKLFKERKRGGVEVEGGSFQTEMEIWRPEDGDRPSTHKAQPDLEQILTKGFGSPPTSSSLVSWQHEGQVPF